MAFLDGAAASVWLCVIDWVYRTGSDWDWGWVRLGLLCARTSKPNQAHARTLLPPLPHLGQKRADSVLEPIPQGDGPRRRGERLHVLLVLVLLVEVLLLWGWGAVWVGSVCVAWVGSHQNAAVGGLQQRAATATSHQRAQHGLHSE